MIGLRAVVWAWGLSLHEWVSVVRRSDMWLTGQERLGLVRWGLREREQPGESGHVNSCARGEGRLGMKDFKRGTGERGRQDDDS